MRNSEDVIVTTLAVRVVDAYEGQRIAGTSSDVVNAMLTKEYRFEDRITICIVDIPARLDRTSGRTYVSGPDGRALNALVRRYLEMLREGRTREVRSVLRMPVGITLPASAGLAA